MKNTVFSFVILLFIQQSYAGFNGLTHHSRANCANNETISWDWTENHLVKIDSTHVGVVPGQSDHKLNVDWQNSWRIAAVHWGEGKGGWEVTGIHWMKDKKDKPYIAASEQVYDCSIYDGWWDKNK